MSDVSCAWMARGESPSQWLLQATLRWKVTDVQLIKKLRQMQSGRVGPIVIGTVVVDHLISLSSSY